MGRMTGTRGADGRLGLEYHLRDMGTNAGWQREGAGATGRARGNGGENDGVVER